ncbi:hypothetical protein CFN78_00115 [Amycolatopsis antarctica]|uniref:Uncharacterized protein n=1 Tax=Amycolatopsis antarctica TaxID=1854586 RepID=A0A263D862_9PSEU|nr:hypothetical protein [Amycolatopsis antarctica]OZM74692.1 hypothetical protein CFN78_00115 [Amycolatopsis antarctica]
MSGYGYEQGALGDVRSQLDKGAAEIDAVIVGVPVVDAGRSSTSVADALTLLTNSGAALAQVLSVHSTSIDLADGSYAEIDNTAEGLLKFNEIPNEPDPHTGPLHDATDQTDTRDYDPLAPR